MNVHRKICITLLLKVVVVDSMGTNDLVKLLLTDYNPVARPRKSFTENITLSISLGVLAILGVDERNQQLEYSGWMNIYWEDHFLTWNTTEYKTDAITIPSNKIWLPDPIIMNRKDAFGHLEDKPSNIIVHSNGTVAWYPGGRYTVFCKVNIKYFPFDVQECNVTVGLWTGFLDKTKISRHRQITTEMFQENPQWDISFLEVKARSIHGEEYAVFPIKLSRRPTFYVITIILPTLILSFLTNLVFVLPAESGERVSLAISVLLSYIVLLTLITELLPSNSDNISLFGVYIIMLIFISGLSILATALILYAHHYDAKKKKNDVASPNQAPDNEGLRRLKLSLDTVSVLMFSTLTVFANVFFLSTIILQI